MDSVLNYINIGILLILGISSLFLVMDSVGFLPQFIQKRIKQRRAYDTIIVLEEMGVDIKRYKKVNQVLNYPSGISDEEISKATQEGLNQFRINKSMEVGHFRATKLKYYYDLIGGTCDKEVASFFANLLCSYWKYRCVLSPDVVDSEFDFVVTPKGGSPILGYEFSVLVNKPLVLHEETGRLKKTDDMRCWFDCRNIPERGKKALIVDDSTTGGTMVVNTIEHLRKYGYYVNTCFVVFEPKAKDARRRLEKEGVQLISIIETHNE